MGLDMPTYPIQLYPGQRIISDPDGLVAHDAKWLAELLKPKVYTFELKVEVIHE